MDENKKADLEKRIRQLEERVAVLEKQTTAPVNERHDKWYSAKDPTVPIETVPEEIGNSQKEKVDWEKRIGQEWLPKVFIFVLLFGVVWAFKAAVDSQLITEPLRVAFGFATAAVMLFFGEKQTRNNRRRLGLTLLGGAIAVLMLTTFAMHMLYGFISSTPSLSLNILWIAGGLYLTYKHKAQTLGILVAFGGYLVPFLLENDQANVYMFSAYVLLLYLSLFVLSVQLKQRILFLTSIGFFHLALAAYAVLSLNGTDSAQFLFLLGVVAAVVLFQQLVVTGVLFKKNLFEGKELPLLFTNLTLTLLWSYFAFNSSLQEEEWGTYIQYTNDIWTAYDTILFSFLVLYSGLTFLLIRRKDHMKVKVLSSVSLFIATLLVLRIFEARDVELALLVESLIVYIIAIQVDSRFQRFLSSILLFISAWLIVFNNYNIPNVFSYESLNFLVLIAVLTAMYKLRKYKDNKQEEKVRVFSVQLLASGLIATLLIFLSALITSILSDYTASIQSMGVSIGWGLFSIAAVVYGIYSNKKKIRFFGLIWILVTLLKLIFVDFEFLSLEIRAILFIVLGVIGMLMSRLFHTNGERKRTEA